MADSHSLSNAQVVLLAARFISDVDVESLQTLAAERRDVLTDDRIYRLLLTLYPNDDAARSALLTLLRSIETNFANVSSLDGRLSIDTSAVLSLTPDLAAREVRRLLLPEAKDALTYAEAGSLSSFIISWCHQVESTDGSLEDVLPLAELFGPSHKPLQEWAERYLLPIARLRYQYYPEDEDNIPGLYELENSSGLSAIRALLRSAEQRSSQADIARDLDGLVVPWLQNTTSSGLQDAWHDVNEWLLSTSLNDFEFAAKALLEWSPPHNQADLVPRYAQAGLAVIYASKATSEAHLQICKRILHRLAVMMNIPSPDTDQDLNATKLATMKETSETYLIASSLLLDSNSLTQVSRPSVNFLTGVLRTAEILLQYKIVATISEVALVCLNGSEERQAQEVRHILQQIPKLTNAMPAWDFVRQQFLWLYSWSSNPSPTADITAPTFLRKVPFQQIHEKLLDCILAQGNYYAAKEIFLGADVQPLLSSTVEDRVVTAILFAYDNASNGNRTRGGLKRAYDLLLTFRPAFPQSERLGDIDHLIRATHSLSFYSLTLQHGVPFQPVNIRAQKDPLALVGKVLDQDTKAYTKLDDLLDIGRNLVLAHLQKDSRELEEEVADDKEVNTAQHKITYLAITSALAAHDFDTAYSYITTRLSLSPGSSQGTNHLDDTSWRAAFAAGRYRPNTTPKSLHERIGSLSKRMDLLSLALTLAPTAEPLSEILGQWRRSEEEMDSLKSQALDEERAFEMCSDGVIPGGFGFEDRDRDANETRQALVKRSMAGGSASYEEQAPMSLFDVASGAARALSRSTQGLRGGSLKDVKIPDSQSAQSRSGAISSEDSEAGRLRKRDMVSNIVTSGLVSGMGWVLGAQAAEKEPSEHD